MASFGHLKNNPGSLSIFEVFKVDPRFRWNVGMGMRNADQALIDRLNGALEDLIANQKLAQVLLRYGIEYVPPYDFSDY